MGQWRVLIAQTVSGTIVADVAPRDAPAFTRRINDKGTWTVNVLPEDTANTHLDLHTYTQSGLYTWVIAYDDVIAQAGPVRTYQWDDTTRNLSVSGCGIQGLFDVRVLHNHAGTLASITNPDNDLPLTNLSLRGIATTLVEQNIQQNDYSLPINVPLAETGTNQRTYQGYDLATVWQRLDELSKVDNGPEFDFRPYLVPGANQVRWDMVVGSPQLGDPNSAVTWDYGGALDEINIDVNGSAAPCTRAYVRGSGTERDLLVGYAEDTTLIGRGFPAVDHVDSDHLSVTVAQTLTDYAAADLAAYAAPTETWKAPVHIDGYTQTGVQVSPAFGGWALGDAVLIGVSNHPWIPDGTYRRRCTGITNNTDITVALELQSTLEVL